MARPVVVCARAVVRARSDTARASLSVVSVYVGDLCFVWDGSPTALTAPLDRLRTPGAGEELAANQSERRLVRTQDCCWRARVRCGTMPSMRSMRNS